MTDLNDLPDLPDVPRHTRPRLADGLDQVVRVGRRRRAIIAATTAGAAATVILLVAVFIVQPVGKASLRYADVVPTATDSPQASPTPPGPATTSQPTPSASEPQASPTAGSTDAPGATASPTGSSPPEQRVREPYTETTQDEAAPLNCVQPPSGSAGPLYYTSGSSCTSGTSGASTVKRGGSVSATSSLCAPYGGGKVDLGYDTGREHEVRVYDGSGDLVYQFSKTVDYTQGSHHLSIADGRCLAWTGIWDTTLTDGQLAPSGYYQVDISVHADMVNGRRTQPQEGAGIQFGVTVQ